MNRFTIGRTVAFAALLILVAAHPTEAQLKGACSRQVGRHRNLAPGELQAILNGHWEWVESFERSGKRADLKNASLASANLKGEELSRAELSEAYLSGAHLEKATLVEVDLKCAGLDGAYLQDANLSGADLDGANLSDAHLSGALLFAADLNGADLTMADLSKSSLTGTNLAEADLTMADLNGAVFETASNPEARDISLAKNLEWMTYYTNPSGMVDLRKRFADGGFRDQERKITYALKREEAEQLWRNCKSKKSGDKARAILWSADSNLANCGSLILNRIFFDWTCQYGMSPGRPLSLGVLLWLLCSILYFASIRTQGESGLYRVYAESIKDDPPGQRRVERITPPPFKQTRRVLRLLEFLRHESTVMRASMFFSIMSAFNIGFRDINFGRWLRLLTRQEFDMKAVGWARVVAGWQSLISVYFIALWVLTYFGRPFG